MREGAQLRRAQLHFEAAIRVLESLGCDPNKAGQAGMTPAAHAAREGHASTLRVLASLPSIKVRDPASREHPSISRFYVTRASRIQ